MGEIFANNVFKGTWPIENVPEFYLKEVKQRVAELENEQNKEDNTPLKGGES